MQGMQWAHATSYHSWWCEYEVICIVGIANTLVVACASYCGYSTEGRTGCPLCFTKARMLHFPIVQAPLCHWAFNNTH